MNWDAVGAIAESVGAVGVIATLAYLAVQVRENAEQLRLGRAQDVSASIQDGFAPIYYPGNPRIWHKGRFHPEDLDEDDARTFELFMDRQLYILQNIVYQHDHGLVDDEIFSASLVIMKDLVVSSPGGSAHWEKRRHLFTPTLRAALEGSAPEAG